MAKHTYKLHITIRPIHPSSFSTEHKVTSSQHPSATPFWQQYSPNNTYRFLLSHSAHLPTVVSYSSAALTSVSHESPKTLRDPSLFVVCLFESSPFSATSLSSPKLWVWGPMTDVIHAGSRFSCGSWVTVRCCFANRTFWMLKVATCSLRLLTSAAPSTTRPSHTHHSKACPETKPLHSLSQPFSFSDLDSVPTSLYCSQVIAFFSCRLKA